MNLLGHLVERTCSLAEEVVGDHKEQAACFGDLGAKWVGKFWEMYQGATDRNMKNVYMGAMNNAGFGGQAQILQPLIEGKMGESDEMRVRLTSNTITYNDYDNIVSMIIRYELSKTFLGIWYVGCPEGEHCPQEGCERILPHLCRAQKQP